MIVRDEEANLPACLDSVADLVDEIIVVDTGSTDRTKEIAARYGARVFDFAWVDSFAAARNESLRHATGDWAFWMDADDRLDEDNRQRLRLLFASLPAGPAAYVLKCYCLSDPARDSGTVVDHVRLFRNHPEARWRYRVHEQILPAVRSLGWEVRRADVVIHHTGYRDPALRRRKLERDLRLLRLEQAEQPDDPFTLFNLGQVALELGRPAEALPYLRGSLERSHPSGSIVRKLYALVAQCHRCLAQPHDALAACRQGRRFYPDDAELLSHEARVLRDLHDLPAAVACLRHLLTSRDDGGFTSVDAGLRGYKTRHNLAVIYQEQGREADAEAQWRAALAERPDYLPAWLGLGELLLRQRRWPELDEVIARLREQPHGGAEAAIIQAQAHLERGDFTAARRLLEEAVARTPQAAWPRLLLSRALLQEDRDPEAAQRALHDVLVLEPDNPEARHNLAVLLQRRGKHPPTTQGPLP